MQAFTFGVVPQLQIGNEDPGDMHLAPAHPGPAVLSPATHRSSLLSPEPALNPTLCTEPPCKLCPELQCWTNPGQTRWPLDFTRLLKSVSDDKAKLSMSHRGPELEPLLNTASWMHTRASFYETKPFYFNSSSANASR